MRGSFEGNLPIFSLMDIYAQNVLDRYKEPFHKDKSIKPDITHREANHSCGDEAKVHLKLTGDKVRAYSWTGVGCAISMASADMLGDLVEGMAVADILKLGKKDMTDMLGIEISLRRSKCALLSLLALQNGILLSQKQEKRSWVNYHL